jgi:hypothetical protein
MILLRETGKIFTFLNAVSMTKLLQPVVATANLIITQHKLFTTQHNLFYSTSVPNVSLDQGFVETAIREKKSQALSTEQIRCWAMASMSASECIRIQL